MKRGDIYHVNLDPAVGHEQRGFRPVLIISATEFNILTGIPVILPITHGGAFPRNGGFAVPLMGIGIETDGFVRCDRPRILDIRKRGGKLVESVPDAVVDDVLARVVALFE
jgi:mRNA-degrading endonuclease toxin of MazEF toxin-antitoxin module